MNEAEPVVIHVAYVDTDVIVRFITGDDPAKMAAATRLFTAAEEGRLSLRCPVTVIADAVYVLTSRQLYGLDRGLVASALTALLDLPHVSIREKPVVRRALNVYAQTGLDFGDAMLVAEMEDAGISTLYSYDHDFDRIPTIRRQEPL